MKYRSIVDAEDLFRTGMLAIYNNTEGPRDLESFLKSIEKSEKNKKPIYKSTSYIKSYILPNAVLSSYKIKLIGVANFKSDILNYFILLLNKATHKPNIVVFLQYGSSTPALRKIPSDGIFRPLTFMLRNIYYSWYSLYSPNDSSPQLVMFSNGDFFTTRDFIMETQENTKENEKRTPKPSDSFITNTITVISYINQFGVSLQAISLNTAWYRTVIEDFLVINRPQLDIVRDVLFEKFEENEDNKEDKKKKKGLFSFR